MNTKHFELSDLRRIPVEVSLEAQDVINASNHQGRLIPLALSEHFGAVKNVASVSIDIAKKQDHFPMHFDPDSQVFLISIKHTYTTIDDHVFYVNADDINELHPVSRLPSVRAGLFAQELARLYPHK